MMSMQNVVVQLASGDNQEGDYFDSIKLIR